MEKLSFIKLDIEIMNDSKIKMIRKMPDGSRLFELWIGLMCLGMKSGRPGCIEIGDGIPFTSRMLSAELDISETTIELGLKTFVELKMIERFEDSTIFLSNFEKHQELEKIEIKKNNERVRKKRYREKIKLLSHGTGQGRDRDGTQCPTLDTDTDTDTDTDVKEINPDYIRLVKYLINHIEKNDNNYFKNKNKENLIAKWYDSIRLLVERDGRDINSIKNIIEWCQNDSFWKTNILSTSKLRTKFPQLLMRYKEIESPNEQVEMKVNNDYDPTGRLSREVLNGK